jgi:hypothetical protein
VEWLLPSDLTAAQAAREHVVHALAGDDLTDGVHRQATTLQQTLDDDAAQFCGGRFGEGAAKFAHGGAGGCNDNDVFHFFLFFIISFIMI